MSNLPRLQGTALGGIDILRFLAAVSVMIYHYAFWIFAFPDGMAGRAASSSTGDLPIGPDVGSLVQSGWIGVQIFFVISGFVIAFTAERATPAAFLRARVLRLVPAVWICAPISILAFWLTTAVGERDAVMRLVQSATFALFGPWADSVYWTLGIEIAFYALILTLLATGQRHRVAQAALAVGLLSTLFWIGFHLSGAPQSLAQNRMLGLLLIHHGCYFALGVQLLHLYRNGISLSGLAWCGVFLLGAVLQIDSAAMLVAAKTGVFAGSGTPVVVFFLAMALMVWTLRRDFSQPVWRQIGIMTYPLYLLHNVVGAALIGALLRAGAGMLPSILVVSLAMIAASWLIATRAEPALRRILDRMLGMLAGSISKLTARPG